MTSFAVVLDEAGLTVGGRRYPLGDGGHEAWLDLHEALARDLGLRRPLSREAPPKPADPHLTPVLTEPVSPDILYGYGDPCVVAVGEGGYRLLVTSNDAADAFPILASNDLVHWRHTGFVFPRGTAPAWTLTGPGVSDFWAPELHRVGGEWWVCFTAREKDGGLAIGLARGLSPDGPFVADAAPLVRGGVIDSHVLVDIDGAPWLVWKKDDNDVWPGLVASLCQRSPEVIEALFPEDVDRRTAALAAALSPWLEARAPMQRFFALQPLIETVAEDIPGFALRLEAQAEPEVPAILQALRTRIFIQRLAADGTGLVGG